MKMLKNTEEIPLLCKLGQREAQIFEMLSIGKKTSEIAVELSLKPNTISTIKKVIYRKLKINTSLEFYKFVFEQKVNKDNA
jgi:DNA-binding NarL/FixJ family response regulator